MALKAGVAGAGVFGGYHANKYAEAAEADLVAVFDMDETRAEALGAKLSCQSFTHFDDFLSAIEVLTIATPASTHAGLARQALEAGKHVLVEKPVAMNVDEADALIALAAQKNLTLQVGHQERYVFDAFGLLSRAAKPKRVESRRLNKFSGRAMDVSVVFDLMIHDLDLLAQLMGAEPESLTASMQAEHGPHSDHTETVLTFADGATARLAASRIVEEPVRDIRLIYDDGEVHLDFLTRSITNTTATPLARDFSQSPDAPLAFRDPLAFGTQSFLQSVITGKPPIVTGGHGRRALKMALDIEQSSRAK